MSFERRKHMFNVGDFIVYPMHGAGKINAKGTNIALACDMSESDEVVCICLETNDEYYV